MTYLSVEISICDKIGFLRIMNLIKIFLSIVRIVIPIILIVMIIKDLFQNVINPSDKEGMHKIVMRLVGAAIIFFIPTLINFVLWAVDYVMGNSSETNYSANSCYKNANKTCINTINTYINCDDIDQREYSSCMAYRSCNSYKLSDNCALTTVVNDDCAITNKAYGNKYFKSGYKKTGD